MTRLGRIRVAPVLAALLTFATRDAHAQEAAVTARLQRFFFRGALGVGYGSFSTGTSTGELVLAGTGALGNFAVGVNLHRSLAVHVDACAMSLVTPTLYVGGNERSIASRADSTSTLSIIGGGVTFSAPGRLLWASASGGVAVLGVEIPGAAADSAAAFGLTQLGWGLNLLVGRDWPIVYNWRVGLALHGIVAQLPDQPFMGSTPTWTALGGGLSLTVTDR